jgi:hypothetical protein
MMSVVRTRVGKRWEAIVRCGGCSCRIPCELDAA